MLKKFFYLVSYGFKKKAKSKSFIIVNIVLFILLIGIANIDSIINFFGGDFDSESTIYVVDNTNEFYDLLKNSYESVNTSILENESKMNFELKDEDIEKLKENLENNIIIEINKDELNYVNAKIISNGYIDTVNYQTIVQCLNTAKYSYAITKNNIDTELLAKISSPVSLDRIILDEGKNSEEENMNIIMSVVFPTLILPFFMLIVLLVQLIGGEINEEKTTRSMEVIISNVSPKVHLYSKIVANNLFVITESILLFLYGAIGFIIRSIISPAKNSVTSGISEIIDTLSTSGLMDKLVYIIPVTLVLMILSFIAYSLLAAILSSMTVNVEDFQQVQTPIMIICLIGYYLSVMAGMFDGSIFIKVLSYIPLISCLLCPSLLIIGQIGIFDVLVSIIIMLIFIFILTKYGVKIYKVGILNYSTDKLWKRMFKAARE